MVNPQEPQDSYDCPTDIIIGKKRPVDNPLVVRYEVGKARCTGSAPLHVDSDFTYGMPSKRDPETAGEVVLTWVEHTKSRRMRELGSKDFVKMNKRSAISSCVTSKDVKGYRQDHDIRVPKTKNRKPLKYEIPISAEQRTFGSRTKTEECVKDLMTNRFALEWVKEQQKIAVTRDSDFNPKGGSKGAQKRQFIHPPVSEQQAPPDKGPFTLSKFRHIQCKVSSCRTPNPQSPQRITLPPISHTPDPEMGYIQEPQAVV